jgi:hypothetical protein
MTVEELKDKIRDVPDKAIITLVNGGEISWAEYKPFQGGNDPTFGQLELA